MTNPDPARSSRNLRARIGWTAATLALAAVGSPALAAGQLYLPRNEYHAAVSANDGKTDIAIFQDVPLGRNEYNNHYSVANPSTWSVAGVAQRYVGYPPEQQPFEQTARASTSDANRGTIDLAVKSDLFAAAASASIAYYFTIIGPAADFVPLTISGYGMADAKSVEPGWAGAGAQVQVNYRDPDTLANKSLISGFGNQENGTFSLSLNVIPNIDFYQGASRIILSAFAWVGDNDCRAIEPFVCAGAGKAMIDPVFTIADPELAKLYTVVGWDGRVLSAPVGPPTSPVPEPATWAMMIAGFGMIGLRLRRRAAGAPARRFGAQRT